MPKTKKTKKRGEKKEATPAKKKSAKRTKKRKIAKEILDGVKQMKKRRPKLEPEPDIPALPVGSIARYYDDGWRHGEVIKVTKTTAVIKPYGPEGQRNAKVPVDDVILVDRYDNPIETKSPAIS